MGELSYVHFYPFSGIGDYQRKRSPHKSLIHAFRLSKFESTIKHLPSQAHKKSTRSYHNGVPRHHPTTNSLAAFPHWVAFFQSTLQCVFLGSHQYKKCPPPPSISHLQWYSWYYSYDPIPLSQFHLLPSPPYCHTLNKGILSLPLPPTPIQFFPFPSSPPIQWVSPYIASHLSVIPHALGQGNIISLAGAGLPLSMPTHIFQMIDPKVPVPWFH